MNCKKMFLRYASVTLALCVLLMSSGFAAPAQNSSALSKAGQYAVDHGIMNGDGKGNYNMNGNIKRGDMIVMIVRALKLSAQSSENFPDVPLGSYYYDAIAAAKSLGISKGDGLNFNPENHVTLEEAISFVERAANVAGITLSVDLNSLMGSVSFAKYASREEVATLLYYVLTSGSTPSADKTLATISYTAESGKALNFSAADFTSAFNAINDGSLYSVRFTLPSSSSGVLYYDYISQSSYGSKVKSSSLYYLEASDYLAKVAFVPKSSYTGTLSILYTAYSKGGNAYAGIIKITVKQSSGEGDIKDISYSSKDGGKVKFNDNDFSDAFKSVNDGSLSYVKFKLPSSSDGVLYYDYTSSQSYDSKVSENTKYYTDSSKYLSKVSFVPKSGGDDTVSISYNAYNEDGDSYSGVVKISVSGGDNDDDAELSDIKYSADSGKAKLDDDDFSDAFKSVNDGSLSYVKFKLPSSSSGVLYYDYTSSQSYDSKVSADTKYYVNSSKYLSKVSFVPKSGCSGTVSISYTAYNEDGDSHSGVIKISVSGDEDNDAELSDIKYSADVGKETKFDEDDFAKALKKADGGDLSYVKFKLPSSSSGVLYYDYTSSQSYDSKVSAGAKYYVDSSKYLSKVSFVPKSGCPGTVSVSYTAYNEDGDSYSGVVKISVSDSDNGDNDDSELSDIKYSADGDEEVKFDDDDFSDAFKGVKDGSLSYVKFKLPSSSSGALYYDYTSSSNYGSKVTSGTKYYVESSKYLSKVSFVPKSGYSSTVSVSYTAYNADGESYSGAVKISVSDDGAGGSLRSIRYSSKDGDRVKFDDGDFSEAFEKASGDDLYYVKFKLPSSSCGTLYYGYTSSSDYGSKVTAGTKYYMRSSKYLSEVYFIPKSGYSGTVSISYTAYNDESDSRTGTVRITVTGDNDDDDNKELKAIDYNSDDGEAVEFSKDDFIRVFKRAASGDLDYVKFELPSSSQGTLYYDYSSPSRYGSKVSESAKYYADSSKYLSDVCFVPESSYTGTLSIIYTAYSEDSSSYSGRIDITVK
ncbi:MAG: S-layer homology domain-containing protein [Bacillota bacterium]|nr:S-layer homology domain-containing protein [Bacillota bacterium]